MSAFLKSRRQRTGPLGGGLIVVAAVVFLCGCQPRQRVRQAASTETPPPPAPRGSTAEVASQRLSASAAVDAMRLEPRDHAGHFGESDGNRLTRGSPSKKHEAATEAVGMARERWLKRLDENGEIPPNALVEAKKQAELVPELPLPQGQRDAGIWAWEWLGPGNIGGRIRSILIHPNDPNTMWIGGVSGGIWRTDNAGGSWDPNAGDSWYPLDDFMGSLAVTSIVMDPTDPNTMYAATGEGVFGTGGGFIFAANGAGIFKSIDGGLTWPQLPATANWPFIYRLVHHPTQPDIIFAAESTGVWRSTDGGNDWGTAPVLPIGVGGLQFTPADVEIDSSDPNRVLVGTMSEVWMSLNGGGTGTWVEQTTDVDADGDGVMDNLKLPSSVAGVGRCELTFGAGGVIWVSMNRNNGEIWNSTDGGATWNLLYTGQQNYLCNPVFPTSCQGNYDNTIWAAPDDPNLVVVGGIDLFRSTDGGATLTQISDWQDYENGDGFSSAHADQHFIVAPPDYGPSNRTLYVANDGGIQQMSNVYTVGQNSGWTNLANNLGITQFYGGAASPTGSVIVGGTQDNDKLRYRPADGPQNWYQAETGDGGYAAVNYNDPNVLYGERPRLWIRKSTDGGDSYSNAINGLTDANANALFIAPFVMDPNSPSVLVAGGSSIWRTTDSANNWGSIRGPTAGNPTPLCSAIDIAKQNSSRIWVGYDAVTRLPANNGRVSRTTTNVSTWVDVDVDPNGVDLLPNRWVTDIAINPLNQNEVFVTFGGIGLFGGGYNNDSIWFTSDNGATWELRQGTAPNEVPAIQVNTIRFHPTNPNWVYVGTDLGVFASEDKGLNWNRTPRFGNVEHDGPVNVEVDELFWQGDEYLIAATFGRGMHRVWPRVVVYVDQANTGDPDEDGSQAHPYDTVQEGIAAAGHGTTISIETGDYDETGVTTFSKRGTVVATNGAVVIH